MRNTIIAMLLLFLCGMDILHAQEVKKNLNFVYIVHDGKSTQQKLSKELMKYHENARRYKHPYIFYLANARSPFVVKMNTPDANPDSFESMLMKIQDANSGLYVNAAFDVKNIVEMFNNDDFLTESGELRYRKVVWNFYISESFWGAEEYGEKLLSTLYWVMDLNSFEDDECFQLYIYHPDNAEGKNDGKSLFGEKNWQNVKGFLTDYIFPY